MSEPSAYAPWSEPTDSYDPDEHADTVATVSREGSTVVLQLVLSADAVALLGQLAQVADRCHEAYERGGEGADEAAFAHLVLDPLSTVLSLAAQGS